MEPAAKQLLLAILTLLRDRDAPAGKTKLLKLMYLADIEHFRATGETLTGFDWVFYMYGPWAEEYEILLRQLEGEGIIQRRQWSAAGLEGEEIRAKAEVALDNVARDTQEYLRTRRLIDALGQASTGELLDYVYFSTEPMRDAQKMARLDFTKISRQAPEMYRRVASRTPSGRIKELRRKLGQVRETVQEESRQNLEHFRKPTFDESYVKALNILNEPGAE